MAIKRSTALKNYMLSGGSFHEAMNNGIIVLYSGTRPDSADDGENIYTESGNPSGNKELVRITTGGLIYSYADGTNGLAFDDTGVTEGSISKVSSDIWTGIGLSGYPSSSNVATWFRFYASGGTDTSSSITNSSHFGEDLTGSKLRFEGGCGAFADLKMATTTITAGVSCTLDVFKISLGD